MQYCITLTLEVTSSEKSVRFFNTINSFLENAVGGVTSMGVDYPSSPTFGLILSLVEFEPDVFTYPDNVSPDLSFELLKLDIDANAKSGRK